RLPEPPDFPPQWIWRALGAGLAGALLVLGLAYLRARAWARWLCGTMAVAAALALGAGGLALLGLLTLAAHISAWRHQDLLLFDPLSLLLLPAWIGSLRARWRPSRFAVVVACAIAALAGFALFLKVFSTFVQDNRFWLALLLPLQAAFAVAM